jgi:NADPH2 dehydrogenase
MAVNLATEYYSQRASVPGTLLISEATFVSFASSGRDANAPGIYTHDQIQQWKLITQAVHAKGSFIYLQIWALGRAARPHVLKAMGLDMVSSSATPMTNDGPTPRPMTEDEIQQCVRDFASASKNAVEEAGFDGVEIHAANGYLIDQFIQDTCNQRTDAWGGSVEKRARFCIEVATAVVGAIGAERTALRLSPYSTFGGMGMQDPIPQFTYLIGELKKLKLSYLHLVEARVAGNVDVKTTKKIDFAIEAWGTEQPITLAGGFRPDSARRAVEEEYAEYQIAISFGRFFISNPDLPYRVLNGVELAKYDRDTFYKFKSPDGYIDYPFSQEFLASEIAVKS